MDRDPQIESLVAPLRDDVVSGASLLARTAADVLRRAAVRVRAGSLDELRWGLGSVSHRVLDAQPAMAPLVALVRDVMSAVEGSASLDEGRLAAASAADHFRTSLETRARAVGSSALPILPVGGTVATFSSSTTVGRLLEAEAVPRGITVVCFESRPVMEGRLLATALAGAGADVLFAVDAAASIIIPTCDAVLTGADSIGDQGVVNKIGSVTIARAARSAGVPVYVLADETKILPRGFPQILDGDRPATEVWTAPEGVRVWNRYFEFMGLDDVTAVVTEIGIETPADFEARRGKQDLPAGLRAWASGRDRSMEAPTSPGARPAPGRPSGVDSQSRITRRHDSQDT